MLGCSLLLSLDLLGHGLGPLLLLKVLDPPKPLGLLYVISLRWRLRPVFDLDADVDVPLEVLGVEDPVAVRTLHGRGLDAVCLVHDGVDGLLHRV